MSTDTKADKLDIDIEFSEDESNSLEENLKEIRKKDDLNNFEKFFNNLLESKCFIACIKLLLWCMTLSFIALLILILVFACESKQGDVLLTLRGLLNHYGLIYFGILYWLFKKKKKFKF